MSESFVHECGRGHRDTRYGRYGAVGVSDVAVAVCAIPDEQL